MVEKKAELSLHDKLIDIQQRLKVPKDNKNDFGGFTYRNLEDIEDKVKPFLGEHHLSLTFEDYIEEVGGRVYVKAHAILSDGINEIKKHAYAREAVAPKAKTDDAQLTGGTSSYARKYAAAGLFLIDNTKDADSQDNSQQNAYKQNEVKYRTDIQRDKIAAFLGLEGISTDQVPNHLSTHYGIPVGTVMTYEQAEKVIKDLEK